MDKAPVASASGDDLDWAERSTYWQHYRTPTRGARRKFHYREPLILCGHGVRINVHRNTLLIRPGFTHYPQEQDDLRFFPGDANLPDRIIIVDADGGLTFDALAWMAAQKIEFIQIDWRGDAISIGGNAAYVANAKLVEAQRLIKASNRPIGIVRTLIAQKLQASIETLDIAVPKSEKSENAISQIRNWGLRLENSRLTNSIPRILGIEGPAAKAYFQAWQGIPLNWAGLARKPIPRDWHEIGPRMMSWRKRARVARHPVNAMLNYGYAILKAKVRAELLAAGFDPTIGFMHGNSSSVLPLVYDLMEPLRPVVDARILAFAQAHTFRPGDFTISSIGGCRLNPQMARAVVRAVDVNVVATIESFKSLPSIAR